MSETDADPYALLRELAEKSLVVGYSRVEGSDCVAVEQVDALVERYVALGEAARDVLAYLDEPTDAQWIAWAEKVGGPAAADHMRHAIEYAKEHGEFLGDYS